MVRRTAPPRGDVKAICEERGQAFASMWPVSRSPLTIQGLPRALRPPRRCSIRCRPWEAANSGASTPARGTEPGELRALLPNHPAIAKSARSAENGRRPNFLSLAEVAFAIISCERSQRRGAATRTTTTYAGGRSTMTITIELGPEEERALLERARLERKGPGRLCPTNSRRLEARTQPAAS
jgi:hypothetical protein